MHNNYMIGYVECLKPAFLIIPNKWFHETEITKCHYNFILNRQTDTQGSTFPGAKGHTPLDFAVGP